MSAPAAGGRARLLGHQRGGSRRPGRGLRGVGGRLAVGPCPAAPRRAAGAAAPSWLEPLEGALVEVGVAALTGERQRLVARHLHPIDLHLAVARRRTSPSRAARRATKWVKGGWWSNSRFLPVVGRVAGRSQLAGLPIWPACASSWQPSQVELERLVLRRLPGRGRPVALGAGHLGVLALQRVTRVLLVVEAAACDQAATWWQGSQLLSLNCPLCSSAWQVSQLVERLAEVEDGEAEELLAPLLPHLPAGRPWESARSARASARGTRCTPPPRGRPPAGTASSRAPEACRWAG